MEARCVEQCDLLCVGIQTYLHQLDSMEHSLEQEISSYLCTTFFRKVRDKVTKAE